MISVTHYQDRDGNTLGHVLPEAVFVTVHLHPHVPQTGAQPLVTNTFTDMDAHPVEREPQRQSNSSEQSHGLDLVLEQSMGQNGHPSARHTLAQPS